MSDQSTPLVPATRVGLSDRTLRWLVGAAVRASLLVSPRPAARLVRRVFAAGGAQIAAGLERHAPPGVLAVTDERYGDEPDLLLDVVRPAAATGRLPLLLWVHGGGWVGGSKDELSGYLKLIASHGYVVAAPSYALAPEHRYPTPLRQLMQALAHLRASAERHGIDTGRIAIAGDSAGAQLAAQLGALVTTPGYAEAVGVTPTIAAGQLRGLVLACGAYDLRLLDRASTPAGRRFVTAVMWAYSGTRRFRTDTGFATWSVMDNLTAAFPPALITVGNADPLRPHSELLAERLRGHGVDIETVFFPSGHRPPLPHEYQFDLDSGDGQRFLDRLLGFLQRRLASIAR